VKRKIEDMTKEEILKEFEGATEHGHVPRRHAKMVPLTIRVKPRLVKELDMEARQRGVSGHTTMARIILESSVGTRRKSLADEIADAVMKRMRARKVAQV
jgi:hypothetical protein